MINQRPCLLLSGLGYGRLSTGSLCLDVLSSIDDPMPPSACPYRHGDQRLYDFAGALGLGGGLPACSATSQLVGVARLWAWLSGGRRDHWVRGSASGCRSASWSAWRVVRLAGSGNPHHDLGVLGPARALSVTASLSGSVEGASHHLLRDDA